MKIIYQKKFHLLLLSVFIVAIAQAQTISIHSIVSTRNGNGGGQGYTLNGSYMSQSGRIKLLNPANFGAAGTYSKTVSIVDAYGATGSLSQASTLPYGTIFFWGAFDKMDAGTQAFTSAEVDSLYNWSKRGGKMIICSGQLKPTFWIGPAYDTRVLNSRWGFSWAIETLSSYLIPTASGSTTDVFSGPFGNITAAYQGGNIQGYFDTISNNTQVLAINANGRPTLIMDCNTLDLIIADVDGYTTLSNITPNTSILTDQDKFWANTIAFMDRLQPLPVANNNNNLLGLNASYVNYQWYYNGQLINGATAPTYSLSQTGAYYAEVTLNGGCKWRSDSLIVNSIATVGADEQLQGGLAPIIYPNPFSTFTQIDFKQEVNDVMIKIIDEAGREVRSQRFSGKTLKIEKENLARGIYLLHINNQDKLILRGKIVIN